MARFSLATSALLLMLAVVSGTASAQSADQIAQRLNAKYQSLTSLQADFDQTMTSRYSDIREQRKGTLLLRGDNYRLDTGDEIYARNGDETWRYSRQQNQVIVSDYMDDEGGFSVNDLFFRYDEMFNIEDTRSENLAGTRHHRLTLEPRAQDSFFEEVTLWMRDRDDIVTRIRMVDRNGTVMDFVLTDVRLNPTFPADAFNPPAGAEVMDLR